MENIILLETFDGDVTITLEQDDGKKEVCLAVLSKDGSGKDFYFITETEMLQLVEAYLEQFDKYGEKL